jgi:hypothetical protein
VEQELQRLPSLSTSTPAGGDEDHPISSTVILPVVSDILGRRLLRPHLALFLASLVERLSDPVASSARGASAVLAGLLVSRGPELYSHAEELTAKLLWQLAAMAEDGCGETRVRALTSMRTLAALDVQRVCDVLLALPVAGPAQPRGLDETLASVWRVTTQEAVLASEVLLHLVGALRTPQIFVESYNVAAKRLQRVARHKPVAAVVGLDSMFRMKEMESVCQGEFASVFVPLLAALCSYVGIMTSEAPETAAKESNRKAGGSVPKVLRAADSPTSGSRNRSSVSFIPFDAAKSALSAFLRSKGCYSVARTAENQFPVDLNQKNDLHGLSLAVCQLYDGIIHDGPQFLSQLAASLESLLLEGYFGRRLTSVAFSVQLLRSEAPGVELALRRGAVANLLSSLQHERELMDGARREVQADAADASSASQRSPRSPSRIDSDGEDAERAAVERRRTECNVLRRLSLKGLARLRDDPGGGAAGLLPSVLSAFLDILSDDPGGVSLAALTGLADLFAADVIGGEDARRVVGEVATRARPFFDSGANAEETAAAIRCLANMAPYAVGEARSVYCEHANGALVSLLLHADGDEDCVRHEARQAVVKLFQVFDICLFSFAFMGD